MSLTKVSYSMITGAPVNVLDYGAKADGDAGTGAGTDNSAAFIAAIAAAGIGGSLFIPAGVFKLGSQVTVPSNFSITGAGPWATILFAPTAFNSDGLIKFNGSGGPPTSISNLAIIGQTGGAGASSVGLNMAANGSFGTNLWLAGLKTQVIIGSTSVFLYNSVIDEGQSGSTGISILYPNTVVGNVQVYNNYIGVSVATQISDGGTVMLGEVQCLQCPYIGFSLSASTNVQINNCSTGSDSATAFSYAGIAIESSSNVTITNFVARLKSQQTTGSGGIYAHSSDKINISNSQISNFYTGISISGGTEITITGNSCSDNYNAGISAVGSDRTVISGNNCNTDGSSVGGNSGIYSYNSSANALHNITGNMCSQGGGGVQEIGIFAYVTDNGASSGFTNITGNLARYNSSAQISTGGKTANIQSTGNF